MKLSKLLILSRVEEALNRIPVAFNPPEGTLMRATEPQDFPLESDRRLCFERELAQIQGEMNAADFVLNLLPKRGFARKDGKPSVSRFYKYAQISRDVWSTFVLNTHTPSKPTLFKIIIGLNMTEQEAREFLALAGSGFDLQEMTDRLILACLNSGITDPDVVSDILEWYKENYAKKHIVVYNIYWDRYRRRGNYLPSQDSKM